MCVFKQSAADARGRNPFSLLERILQSFAVPLLFFVAAFDDLPSSSSLSAAALKTEKRAGCSARPKKGSSSSSSFLLRAPPPPPSLSKASGPRGKERLFLPRKKLLLTRVPPPTRLQKKSRKVKSTCLKAEKLSSSTRLLVQGCNW